jgi:hypothetical protein
MGTVIVLEDNRRYHLYTENMHKLHCICSTTQHYIFEIGVYVIISGSLQSFMAPLSVCGTQIQHDI